MARWAPPCGSPAWPWKKLEQRLPRWSTRRPLHQVARARPGRSFRAPCPVRSFRSCQYRPPTGSLCRRRLLLAGGTGGVKVELCAWGHHRPQRVAGQRGACAHRLGVGGALPGGLRPGLLVVLIGGCAKRSCQGGSCCASSRRNGLPALSRPSAPAPPSVVAAHSQPLHFPAQRDTETTTDGRGRAKDSSVSRS